MLFLKCSSIDATQEPGLSSPRLSRLVNHGDIAIQRNARMKILDGSVLALYAIKPIAVGDQILYDYGIQVPWTGEVC